MIELTMFLYAAFHVNKSIDIVISPPQKQANYKNNMYFFGPCIAGGIYTSDNYTIESYLQKALHNGFRGTYGAINCGVGSGRDTLNDFEYMLDTNFKPGDIVVNINRSNKVLQRVLSQHKSNQCETSHLFDRPHNHGHWMLNNGFHINHVGNEVIANYIYDVLKPQLSKSSHKDEQKTVKYQFENEVDTFLDDNPDFKRYLDGLKSIKVPTKTNGKVGSIVMNCNPFTLGHRYLIEQAAAQVDHLPTFVINPLHTHLYRKGFSLRKTKTDKVDSRIIATMMMSDMALLNSGIYKRIPCKIKF